MSNSPQNIVGAFWKAVRSSDTSAMRSLFESEPSVLDKLLEAGTRIVCEAARKSSPEAIALLLEFGVDGNEQDSNGWTGLCWAVTRGRTDAAKVLLEAGVDPNIHCPILDVLSQHNDDPIAMARLLLEHGADVNQSFIVEGLPPRNILSRAIEMGKDDLVAFLKSRGAELPGKLPSAGEEPTSGEPIEAGDHTTDILAHFRKHYGKPSDGAITQVVSASQFPVRVHYVAPSWRRRWGLLFTVGLSRYAMPVPHGAERFRLAELVVAVPDHWPVPQEAIKEPQQAWPIQWLFRLAAYPITHHTWLGGPWTTLANEDPPQPLGPGTRFSAWGMASPEDKKSIVRCRDGRRIQLYQLYQLYPLYTEEYLLERQQGVKALMDKFSKTGLPEYIDNDRANTALA